MRLPCVVLLLSLLSTTACVPPRPPDRAAPLLTVASGEERFGRVRGLLADLASQRYPHVRIRHGGTSSDESDVVVDLPATRQANGLDVLVIVRVHESTTTVGRMVASTDAELVRAARRHTRDRMAVALVRAEDQTLVRDVVRVIRAMKAGGFDTVVLASLPGDADPTPEGWNGKSGECSFPEGTTSLDQSARVEIEDDGHGRPATVRILESRSPAHAYAAAVCASIQRIDPGANGFRSSEPLRQRLMQDTPVLKAPRDP